nr:thiolase family protein [Nitrospinota bacterium]
LNTGGGQLSTGQNGLAGGAVNVIEAVRQLQREGGARQVEKCDNALVTGIGTVNYLRNWHSSAVMVLEV